MRAPYSLSQAKNWRKHSLNAHAVAVLIGALPDSAKLVMISTDQVYPDTAGPHVEGDARLPLLRQHQRWTFPGNQGFQPATGFRLDAGIV